MASNQIKSQGKQRYNPFTQVQGSEDFNPFSGNFNMKSGEGLNSFRSRLASQIKTAQTGMNNVLDPTRQAGAIGEIAKGLTTGISGDQAAGQAVEDVDQQFAGQEKAMQLRQSRMGIDPSQGASITGQRQQRIAQASARAGAMQSARRGAEQSNMNQFQNNLGLGANLVGRQTEFQLQQGQQSLQQLQGQGRVVEGMQVGIQNRQRVLAVRQAQAQKLISNKDGGLQGYKNSEDFNKARAGAKAFFNRSISDKNSYGQSSMKAKLEGGAYNQTPSQIATSDYKGPVPTPWSSTVNNLSATRPKNQVNRI